MTDLNGVAYPTACYEDKENYHFFIIGDWGGMCGWGAGNDCNGPDRLMPPGFEWPKYQWSPMWPTAKVGEPWPMRNQRGKSNFIEGIDEKAQHLVRDAMVEVAKTSKPEFVISVGDNFYPGGIIERCEGSSDGYDFDRIPQQFNTTFEMMYTSPELDGKEWMSVMGNHDYGGTCVQMGWPQQIWYTWNTQKTRWVMPAQYYSRRMFFGDDISVDMFFLDSNLGDAGTSDRDHHLCTRIGNTFAEGDHDGYHCAGFLGDGLGGCPATEFKSSDFKSFDQFNGSRWSARDCQQVFRDLWDEQLVWLENLLKESTADWQMIVTHFPPWATPVTELKPLLDKYGVDFVMMGHTHSQLMRYKESYIDTNWGDTAWVVSGGGGGITSEGPPNRPPNGQDDQYGFVDVKVAKDTLEILMYSYLPEDTTEPILRRSVEVAKKEPAVELVI